MRSFGKSRNPCQSGFTLFQVSILLTVAALVMVAVLPASQTKLTNNNVSSTRLNAILTALRQFQASNGYLPCPANPYLPQGSPYYGTQSPSSKAGPIGNCINGTPASANTASAAYADTTNHIALGMVPVNTLNLSNDYAVDGYGRTITYAVDTNATTCWSATTLTGAVTVNDNGTVNNSVLALVSHGADGYGAWIPLQGSSGAASRLDSGSTDIYQADNAQVNHGTNSGGLTINTTFQPFYKQAPTATFDDLVAYKNPLWNFNSEPASWQTTSMAPVLSVPANGTYSSAAPGTVLTFTLTFPTVVSVTVVPNLSLDLHALSGGSLGSSGNLGRATYTGGNGTKTLTFQYRTIIPDTAPNGIYITSPVDMAGGIIRPCLTNFTVPNLSQVLISTTGGGGGGGGG